MKSKYIAPTIAHKADHTEIDRVMRIEQGYIEQAIILAAAVALSENFGFGVFRIEQFAGLAYKSIDRFLKAAANQWPDIMRSDCERMKVPVDESLIVDRGRNIAPIEISNVRPCTVPQEQQKAMDDILTSVLETPRLPTVQGVSRLQMPGIRDVKYSEEKIAIERAFIADCFVTACAKVLFESFSFGRQKVMDFAHATEQTIFDLFDFDPDIWIDLAERNVRRIGVKVKDGWIVGKERNGEAMQEAPELSAVQNAFITKTRTELLTDEQSRRSHRSFINDPQRKK